MLKNQKKALLYLLIFVLFGSGLARASSFMALCQNSLRHRDELLTQCDANARPFERQWYPGGQGEPVPVAYRAWFDTADNTSHFGFGCVLGPKSEVRFFGLYYFLKADNFRQANSARFAFIDDDGNAGLKGSDDKSMFTLLAVHRLTPPGQKPVVRDRNCELGGFEPSLNITVLKVGDWFKIYKVRADGQIVITQCEDREVRFEKDQCFSQPYRSFVNGTKSRILEGLTIVVTEDARLFISKRAVRNFCELGARPAVERMNFVKEACASVE